MLDHPVVPCGYVITQSIKQLDEETKQWCLGESDDDDNNWWYCTAWDSDAGKFQTYKILVKNIDEDRHRDTIFYQEKWVKRNNGREERLVVNFSLKYRTYLRGLREEHLKRALKKLKTNGKRKRQTDPGKLIQETHTTKNGDKATKTTCEINWKKLEEEERYDGFYCVSTDLNDDVRTICPFIRTDGTLSPASGH